MIGSDDKLEGLYAEALRLAQGVASSASAIERLAKTTSVEASRWAFTQWELRKRAAPKFKLADSMLFEREALEQASHEKVADYRASRFPQEVRVLDGTCSIGADLIALAKRGEAVGCDLNPDRLRMASWNLEVHGLEAELSVADCMSLEQSFDFVYFDPARRVSGRRTIDPADFTPEPTLLVENFDTVQMGMLKLSPLLQDDFLESLGPQIEFWSYGRECREAVVVWGTLAEPSWRAIHIESGSSLESGEPPLVADNPSAFLFEADPASIRAHALGTLAEAFDLMQVGDTPGYLTGESYCESPWLRAYRVLDTLPGQIEKTGRYLRDHGMRLAAVKSRTSQADVEALTKAWRKYEVAQGKPVIVAAASSGKRISHIVLEIIESP